MSSTTDVQEPTTRRILNLRALAVIVGGLTLMTVLTGWLHAHQIERTQESLRADAEQAVKDGDPNRAFDLFEQYLILNPRDPEVEEQVSLLLDEHGTSAKALLRAFQINERLLLTDKSRDDLRLRQIRISDRLKRYSDAAVHLKILREKRSDLSSVWHFSGVVAKDTGAFSEAQRYFTKAVALENPVPDSFKFLADLLTTHAGEPEAAERLLGRLVAEFDTAEARHIRAAWFQNQNRHADAIADLYDVISTEPLNTRANAMLLQAVRLAAEADHRFPAESHYTQIIQHLQETLASNPDEHSLRLYLSSALWAVDEKAAAISNLEYGIERDPRQYEMHQVLVDYLVGTNQFDRAQEVFESIPDRVVDRGRMEFMRGRLLMAQRNWLPAINAFELALSFAGSSPEMATRCRISLALCRREAGDSGAALDAYRSLVKTDPDSEGGRLGMASAYLRSNRISLAIAEYRQLLHVDGVPEFLANLMIREIMKLPPASRDWSEVEALLDEANPIVEDVVQRTLLLADLRFAQGYPSRAMDILDLAAEQMPESEEIQRALQRLASIHAESLNKRVLGVLEEDPTNLEAHISVLRLQLRRGDTADMTGWLNGVLSGRFFPQLDSSQRLLITGRAAVNVIESDASAGKDSEQVEILVRFAAEAWRRLAKDSSRHLFTYIRFLARHDSVASAIRQTVAATNASVQQRAECWLECLRHGSADQDVRTRVYQELTQLISQNSSDLRLRIVYADALIIVEEYETAQKLLEQLARRRSVDGAALARLAWLSLLIHSDSAQALKLSEQATLKAPSDAVVRSIRGLVLAEAGHSPQALDVLQSIPTAERATASYLYEARTLYLRGRSGEAAERLREVMRHAADLPPAESRMMKTLQQDLKIAPPRVSQR